MKLNIEKHLKDKTIQKRINFVIYDSDVQKLKKLMEIYNTNDTTAILTALIRSAFEEATGATNE